MGASREVVITGLGVVSPIGVGREAYWSSLLAGQSGVRRIDAYTAMPKSVAMLQAAWDEAVGDEVAAG